MCGIIGINSSQHVATDIYEGLISLQHRGQDAAGISTYNGHFHVARGRGYVREAFTDESMRALSGSIGIGHTRYTTAGSATDLGNSQPFFANAPLGVALVHNGNLTNYRELRTDLSVQHHYQCNSESDTEVLLGVFVTALRAAPADPDIFQTYVHAVESVMTQVRGAYSVIGMIAGDGTSGVSGKGGLFAFRDPHGIRPLVYGTRARGNGTYDVIIASENSAFSPLGYTYGGDILPGEAMFVDAAGHIRRTRIKSDTLTPDVFEYIYFARPDSFLNQISVYRARQRMGKNLAARWRTVHPDVVPDVVVPVPFSSNPIALAMALELGVPYSEGLYKNAFIGRTFIMPGVEARKRAVKRKLSPQTLELADKNVLIVDDSIVRGTTSREVVDMVRGAGAKKIYFASAAPPIKYPDYYGIDIPTKEELIASYMTEDEIRTFIGADILLYQTIEDLVDAVTRRGDHAISRLSMPYLDGWYVTADITNDTAAAVAAARARERQS